LAPDINMPLYLWRGKRIRGRYKRSGTIHLVYRLTTDLAQRRRDAEKDIKVFLCLSVRKY